MHFRREVPSVADFVLVFALLGDRFAVGRIAGRGWCIPSGGVEPGETPSQAAERELREEVGGVLEELVPFGSVLLSPSPGHETSSSGAQQVGIAFVGQLRCLSGPREGFEALEATTMDLDELRKHYFDWSPYYEAIFTLALEEQQRRLRKSSSSGQ